MKSKLVLFAVTLFLGMGSRAHAADAPVNLGAPDSGVRTEIIEVTAKVVEIDPATRRVTLEDAQGGTLTVRADDQVQNLKDVKKGDLVVIKYQKSIAWQVLKDKEKPTKTVTQTTTTSEEGKKPELAKTTQTDIVASITAIDKAAPSATLKGPDGNSFTVQIKNPQVLEGVKVGDQVAISYTEAIAASVEKAKK